MKYKILLAIYFLSTIAHNSLLHAACPSTLTQVSGSPFTGGSTPRWIAYSPLVSGNLFAALGNATTNNVSVYSANTTTGVFTPVTGSPFAAGNGPRGIAFSPLVSGNLFAAVCDRTDGTVSVYSVNTSTGFFTPVTGSPFTAPNAYGVAFTPLLGNNLFAAVTNTTANTVSVFSVNTSTGVFTQIPGSPYPTGSTPMIPSFSPLVSGNLFIAIPNSATTTVTVYQVNTTTGAFTSVPGSPFTATSTPWVTSFSPLVSGNLFCAASSNGLSISIFKVNITTGVFTQIPGSPFSIGNGSNSIAFSPLIGSNLFLLTGNQLANTASFFQINTSTGTPTQVTGSPFGTGSGPTGVAFSPLVSGNLFAATGNVNANNTTVFQVITPLSVALTTLSQYIINGNSLTLNGSITGGTSPYAVTWQDSTVQSGINTTTFSRIVSPTISTIYDVATITDTNSCTAGPSNSITIAVRTCP